MKKLIALLIILYLASFAFAQEEVSTQEYSDILSCYFRDRNETIAEITANYFKKMPSIPATMQGPIFGFYSELFKDKAIRENTLALIKEKCNSEIVYFFESVVSHDGLDSFLARANIQPELNDIYIAAFYASGNTDYLLEIFRLADRYYNERKDIYLYLTASSGLWALASHVHEYNEVKALIEEKADKINADLAKKVLQNNPDSFMTEALEVIREEQEKGNW